MLCVCMHHGAIDPREALGPSPSVPPWHTTYMCMHVAQTRSAQTQRTDTLQVVNTLYAARGELETLAAMLRAAGWQNVTQRLVGPPCVERPAPKQRPLHEHGGLDKAAPPRRACAEPRWTPRANVIVSASRGDSRGGPRSGQRQVRVRAPPRRS